MINGWKPAEANQGTWKIEENVRKYFDFRLK